MPYHQVGKHSTNASVAWSRATCSATPTDRGRGVVGAPLNRAQHRVEPLAIEVAIVDLVAASPQLRDNRAMQRSRETVGQRVRENDENRIGLIAPAVVAGSMLTMRQPGCQPRRRRCAAWCSWATVSSN